MKPFPEAAPWSPQCVNGRFTLPVDERSPEMVRRLAERWGADALRDSDGTQLSGQAEMLGLDLYSTICLVRADQDYARSNPEAAHRKFLLSARVPATAKSLVIRPLDGYHPEKYELDTSPASLGHWQVIDRSTGDEIARDRWQFDPATCSVQIATIPGHLYTVSVLAKVTWDTTSMYNHMVNQWSGPKVCSVDPFHEKTRRHLMEYFRQWLVAHDQVAVVRLTTLAYHFNVDFDCDGDDLVRDWMGYQETISLEALECFERRHAFRLTAEDFIDEGFYNTCSRVPSRNYRLWMEFIGEFVVSFGRELVEMIHAAGKKAAIFHGDHWIGVEPFTDHCQRMGIDIQIGACEDGVALRRVADSPGAHTKEIRLYPYFFPDVFRPGGEPTTESIANWIKIRRALVRNPVDRIGYGGYLKLLDAFPDFIDQVGQLAREFREIRAVTTHESAWDCGVRVGVLSAWGKLRSWINPFGRDQKFLSKRQDVVEVAGSNLLECLSGLPVQVEFLDFEEIKEGALERIDVLINDGDFGTAWSGAQCWADSGVSTTIRQWVAGGGAFLGCRAPSAYPGQGVCFQLSDVLGVDLEIGSSVQIAAAKTRESPEHALQQWLPDAELDDVEKTYIFPCSHDTEILLQSSIHVVAAAHPFHLGRSLYLASLPYSPGACAFLHRALLWLTRHDLSMWTTDNPKTECAWFPSQRLLAVMNLSTESETSTVSAPHYRSQPITVPPAGLCWLKIEGSEALC